MATDDASLEASVQQLQALLGDGADGVRLHSLQEESAANPPPMVSREQSQPMQQARRENPRGEVFETATPHFRHEPYLSDRTESRSDHGHDHDFPHQPARMGYRFDRGPSADLAPRLDQMEFGVPTQSSSAYVSPTLNMLTPERRAELELFMTRAEQAALRSGACLTDVDVAHILGSAARRERDALLSCDTPCQASAGSNGRQGACLLRAADVARLEERQPGLLQQNIVRQSKAGQFVSACRVGGGHGVDDTLRLKARMATLRVRAAKRAALGTTASSKGDPESFASGHRGLSLASTVRHSLGLSVEEKGKAARRPERPIMSLLMGLFQLPFAVAHPLSTTEMFNEDEILLTAALYSDFSLFQMESGKDPHALAHSLMDTTFVRQWQERLAVYELAGNEAISTTAPALRKSDTMYTQHHTVGSDVTKPNPFDNVVKNARNEKRRHDADTARLQRVTNEVERIRARRLVQAMANAS